MSWFRALWARIRGPHIQMMACDDCGAEQRSLWVIPDSYVCDGCYAAHMGVPRES